MPVVMQLLNNELRFTISGLICQRVSDWERTLDEMVFNEQLITGSFRGRCPVDDEMRAMMQALKIKGHIAPYYGVSGGRGSCEYILQRTNNGYVVRVENTTAEESAEFTDEADSNLPQNPVLILKIDGNELLNLRRWEHWVERQAATSRYIYKFGQVAMGRLGYTVKVEDTRTGSVIDATGYEDW